MLQQKKVNFFYCMLCCTAVSLMTTGVRADGSGNSPWSAEDKAWNGGEVRRPWGNVPKEQGKKNKDYTERHHGGYAAPGYQGSPYPSYSMPYHGYQPSYNQYGSWDPYMIPGTGYGYPGSGGPGYPGLGYPGPTSPRPCGKAK